MVVFVHQTVVVRLQEQFALEVLACKLKLYYNYYNIFFKLLFLNNIFLVVKNIGMALFAVKSFT